MTDFVWAFEDGTPGGLIDDQLLQPVFGGGNLSSFLFEFLTQLDVSPANCLGANQCSASFPRVSGQGPLGPSLAQFDSPAQLGSSFNPYRLFSAASGADTARRFLEVQCVLSVPEPGTLALLLGGLATVGILRPSRQRRASRAGSVAC
jgi:hypothetical protein